MPTTASTVGSSAFPRGIEPSARSCQLQPLGCSIALPLWRRHHRSVPPNDWSHLELRGAQVFGSFAGDEQHLAEARRNIGEDEAALLAGNGAPGLSPLSEAHLDGAGVHPAVHA